MCNLGYWWIVWWNVVLLITVVLLVGMWVWVEGVWGLTVLLGIGVSSTSQTCGAQMHLSHKLDLWEIEKAERL